MCTMYIMPSPTRRQTESVKTPHKERSKSVPRGSPLGLGSRSVISDHRAAEILKRERTRGARTRSTQSGGQRKNTRRKQKRRKIQSKRRCWL